MKKVMLGLASICYLFGDDDAEKVFTEIYHNRGWGANEAGKGFSGSGSTVANTKDYIAFIENFIQTNRIKTVVDAGCGDWTFSKEIDWGDIQYLGVDVVKEVIDEDNALYSSDTIHFQYLDILRYELPAADLLICKDVLMHLSNSDIIMFLKATSKFKHCLFTNNIDGCRLNHDISRGDFRPLDLTQYPFYLNGVKVLTYTTDHAIKLVLYHGN